MATNILSNCHFDLSKIKKLYLGIHASTGGTINFPLDYDVVSDSYHSVIQYSNWTTGNIITIGSQNIQLYEVLSVGDNITFGEVLIIDQKGRNYLKTISFEISGLDQDLIDKLELNGLTTNYKLHPIPTFAILVDDNNQYLIVGYDVPLKLDSISNGIDKTNNNVIVTYKTTSISRARSIDFSTMPS